VELHVAEELLNLDPELLLRKTPLDALHRGLGAKMGAFAGYEMPIQYPAGVLAEHLHCRAHAALFDVSHMGQMSLVGEGAATMLERLTPGDFQGLARGRQRYTVLLNEAGGILDDLMVARHSSSGSSATSGGRFVVIANASRKDEDARHLAENLPDGVKLELHFDERALLALQGPESAAILGRLAPDAAALPFMGAVETTLAGLPAWISRSGYTGEDGFEISVPTDGAERVARLLLEQPGVLPAGLGARDSLRLEAGLPLYGADIDELTTPVEARLAWCISKRRRAEGGFLGAAVIGDQLANGPARLRVGLRPDGRTPARAGVQVAAPDGTGAGTVTSGGFSPTLGVPVAMAYLRRDVAGENQPVQLVVRGTGLPGRVVPLPFVPHRYARPERAL
jgi:aminomethyltransferase